MTHKSNLTAPQSLNRGFTLTEFILALAVLSVLAVLSMPMLRELVITGQVRSAAMDIYGGMTFARSEAIKRNVEVTISPTGGDWKNGWTIAAADAPETLAAHDALAGNLAPLPGGEITYTRDGRLVAGADFVVNVNASGSTDVAMRCVTVRASGQPNIRIDKNRDGNCENG
jgi:type IV fimbrial biogenesis protein FimT